MTQRNDIFGDLAAIIVLGSVGAWMVVVFVVDRLMKRWSSHGDR